MNTYIAFCTSKPGCHPVVAATSHDAFKQAVLLFRLTPKQAHKVHVILTNNGDAQVSHSTAGL